MATTTKVLNKKGCLSSFTLIGKVKIDDKRTFNMNQKSKKSDWIFNQLNLGIDCGEKHGTVFCEAMGGYGAERKENKLYVHGKDDDGRDNFQAQFQIDWEDRKDEDILSTVGNNCFITAGIELDTSENIVYQNFLSEYDFIEYLKENLKTGMVVKVRGDLEYHTYDKNTKVQKKIKSVILSKAEESDFSATFMQTVLLQKNCIGEIDKLRGVVPIKTRVIDYYNDKKNKGYFTLPLTFEYAIPESVAEEDDKLKKILNKLFKVKKDVTKATFLGEFIESGSMVQATIDDLTDDLKTYIDLGIYTEEEALDACSKGGPKERRMLLIKPYVKKIEDDKGNIIPVIQIFEKAYTDEDLVPSFLLEKDDDTTENSGDAGESADDANLEDSESIDDELEDLLNSL